MPPRLARLLAIVAAIALVGGALVLRGALSGNDDEGVSSGPGSTEGGGDPDAPIRLICDEDLGDACDVIGDLDEMDGGVVDVMTAEGALSEDALGADTPAYDAWVTLDPWPQVLDEARNEGALNPVAEGEGVELASSTLSLLTYEARGVACDEPVDWACLAEAATNQDIGLPALSTAAGPLVLGAAAIGLLDDPGFGIGAVRSGEVRNQLNDLLDSADLGPLADEARAIATQRGRYGGLVTIDGLARSTASTPGGQGQGLTLRPLAPEAIIGVVLAPIEPNGRSAVDRLAEGATGQTVTAALADAGWSGEAAPSSGLPVPDLLYALNEDFRR